MAGHSFGVHVPKVFVMDGDALATELELGEPILQLLTDTFPNRRRVS